MTFYNNVTKELKLKVRKFLGLILTFVEGVGLRDNFLLGSDTNLRGVDSQNTEDNAKLVTFSKIIGYIDNKQYW